MSELHRKILSPAAVLFLAATCALAAGQPKPFVSPVVEGGSAPMAIHVNVSGWPNLFLIVSDEGDYSHDVANWAEARIVSSSGKTNWLDETDPVSATQAWGKFKRDNKSAVSGPMKVASKLFDRGLGTHAASTLHYRLPTNAAYFDASVGIDASRRAGEGRVRFIVSPTPDIVADTPPPQPKTSEFEALRLAINDLKSTFGPGYPGASGYLARLERLENIFTNETARASGAEELLATPGREFRALQRESLLANPLLDFDRVLVLLRKTAAPARSAGGTSLGVGAANWSTADAIPRSGVFSDSLVTLSDLRGSVSTQLVYSPLKRETLIDPVLHFNADRVLFAMNGETEKNWRLWELSLSDKVARQLTPNHGADVGHFDPCYLADGRIAFASTASYQGLPCVFGSEAMTCLYLFDPAGNTIRQLTFEQDSDWCPTVLNNGRVMYLRWEYTDQSHANSRILFHMNPDGTDQREYRGSGSWFPGSFFYARAIPGQPHQIVGIAGGHHGTARSGRLLIMDPSVGRRDGEGIVQEIPGRGKKVEPIVRDRLVDGVWPQFLTPAPLNDKYHLVAAKLSPRSLWGIYLVDVFDNMTLIKEVEGAALLWPMPLLKRERPPVIEDRIDPASGQSSVFVADVHSGPGLQGIPRGTVKALRVVEYYFARRGMGGLYGTLGADGPWDIKRILGTVPVDADGSAYFTMPANTPVCVQPLDDRGQALQLERSWFVGMPGERVSCIGCHESQDAAALARPATATRRPPAQITPWHGPARGFSFVREVQPVLDRYCVSCHDGSPDAVVNLRSSAMLTNWQTQLSGHWPGGGKFSEAYWELQRYVRRPGIEGDRRMFTPMDYHFSTTELGQLLRKGHYGVDLDAQAWERLAAWVDLNAPFYGTWGEIPQFTSGYGHLKSEQVVAANARALELRRKYVPAGPFPDYEAIADIRPSFAKATEGRPSAIPHSALRIPHLNGWPFDEQTAMRKQQLASGDTRRVVDLGDGVTLELVRVPGGRFVMGSSTGHPDEQPQSVVDVKPFWMARFETSNRQFRQFDAAHESRTEDRHGYQFGAVGYNQDSPAQPAVRVSWEESMAFCRWLSARTKLSFGLPTEAQWEWACRAGSESAFWFGNLDSDYSPYANLGDRKLREFAADTSLDNYSAARPMKNPGRFDDWLPRDTKFDDGGFITEPVGKYRANAWGLHDMHGNAWEWTLSQYQRYPYTERDGRNDVERAGGNVERVARGGSWRDRPFRCTASYRLPYRQYQRVFNVGFRVVCNERQERSGIETALAPSKDAPAVQRLNTQ